MCAMCFDTTAANTGRFSGACILLEAILDRSLLWIACRHHMLEVVLSQVFKSIFGDSVGPNVELFQQLKNQWQSVDFTQSTYHLNQSTTACLQEDVKHAYQSVVKIKSDPSYLSRDNYEELLNLATYYIDEKSFSNFSFRCPGAQHRARWMSSCIYSLKTLLLQEQLQVEETDLEKLQSFGDFVAISYSSFWFLSPLASEAAYNDLMFYKTMLKYQSSSTLGNIAHNAAKALSRHLWYLTEELIPFALCSKQLASEEKEVLARRMFQLYRENQQTVLAPQKPVLPHITETTRISDLAGRRSVLLFQRFRFTIDDVQFLRQAQSQWCKSDSYQRLERLVFNIKVTNDTAERGIKILED